MHHLLLEEMALCKDMEELLLTGSYLLQQTALFLLYFRDVVHYLEFLLLHCDYIFKYCNYRPF